MADTKISALTADSTPGYDSLLVTIDDPGGTPASRKTTISELLNAAAAPANTSLFSPSGYSLTGTDATSAIDVAGTWNTTGTPSAIKLNITDTASNAASLLIDLQVGGTSKFKVDKTGVVTIGGDLIDGPSFWDLGYSGNRVARIQSGTLIIDGNLRLGAALNSADVIIDRDASNTLALRNSTNAQTFNIYNTYTDASNYERGFISWNDTANVLVIGTEAAGSGAVRTVHISPATNTLTINASLTYFQNGSNIGMFGINQAGTPNSFVGTQSANDFAIRTNNSPRLVLDTTGSVEIRTALTVATLPGTPAVGMMARVTDANAPAVGSTVSGGGAANALVWYNGTNWTVMGV